MLQAIPSFGQSRQQIQNQASKMGLQGTGALATPPVHTHTHTRPCMCTYVPVTARGVASRSDGEPLSTHPSPQETQGRAPQWDVFLSFFLSHFTSQSSQSVELSPEKFTGRIDSLSLQSHEGKSLSDNCMRGSKYFKRACSDKELSYEVNFCMCVNN